MTAAAAVDAVLHGFTVAHPLATLVVCVVGVIVAALFGGFAAAMMDRRPAQDDAAEPMRTADSRVMERQVRELLRDAAPAPIPARRP